MNWEKELAALQRATYVELQTKHAALFGETPPARNKKWLIKRLAWRLQANAEGDLSERAKARIREIANDADLRLLPPRAKPAAVEQVVPVNSRADGEGRLPTPGTVLARPYKGQVHQVTVLEEGFQFEGEVYRSLSAVAKVITGTHCNGYQFFRLGGRS